MNWNWIDEKRKAQPDAWRIATVVDERLHNAVLNGTLSEKCAMRRHDSADLAALSLVLGYRAVNGDRAMTSDEIEVYADLAMTMLNHSGGTDNSGTPICVWDNIRVLYGRCGITPLFFAKLYSRFGMNCEVIDLICIPERELQRMLGIFDSRVERIIKSINNVVYEDVTIPNPSEETMRRFIVAIAKNARHPNYVGPIERYAYIVMRYYLYNQSIDAIAEEFKRSKLTIEGLIRDWRHSVTRMLDRTDVWDDYFNHVAVCIFDNSPYNTKYPEFSFLHRIRFLMMHRTEMSRTDNVLLKRIMKKLKKYDSSCMVSRRENNE